MSVHWHDDEHAWCPCDEVTAAHPDRVAAWFRTIRYPEPYYQPCGCLTNDSNAHRGGCPDWCTVKGEHGQAIRWVKRAADSGEVGS